MTRTSNTAVVCFVKTPGLSPVKTRLAGETSIIFAEMLYSKCLKIYEELLSTLQDDSISVYWAISELEAQNNPLWSSFETVVQRGQGLGERISSVFNEVSNKYEKTILLGSDSPQLTVTVIRESIKALDSFEEVVGPSIDGGFYLYGNKLNKANPIWLEVSYSRSDTRFKFCNRTDPSETYYLRPLSDLDHRSDIELIKKDLELTRGLSKHQSDFLKLISIS